MEKVRKVSTKKLLTDIMVNTPSKNILTVNKTVHNVLEDLIECDLEGFSIQEFNELCVEMVGVEFKYSHVRGLLDPEFIQKVEGKGLGRFISSISKLMSYTKCKDGDMLKDLVLNNVFRINDFENGLINEDEFVALILGEMAEFTDKLFGFRFSSFKVKNKRDRVFAVRVRDLLLHDVNGRPFVEWFDVKENGKYKVPDRVDTEGYRRGMYWFWYVDSLERFLDLTKSVKV